MTLARKSSGSSVKHLGSLPPLGAGLTDRAAAVLRGLIRDGRWVRGNKLPTEAELVDTLQVSRTVVREAVSRLKSEGLLVSRQGSGVFVAQDDVMRSLRFDERLIGSTRSVLHIIEIRRAFEGEAAALAALRATPAQTKTIERALAAIAAAVAVGQDGVAEDMAFHHAIALATGNRYFAELFDFLEQYLRAAMRVTRGNEATRADYCAQVIDEHQAILAALRAGDPDRARRAAALHMDNAALRLTSRMPHR